MCRIFTTFNNTTMKKTLLALVASLVALTTFAQKSLPSANVKTLEGQTLNVQELGKSGKITVISFWATWCSPCKKELDAIKDYYDEWKEKYGVELIAVSVDDARTAAKVPAMVKEKGWEYRILLDTNKEFSQTANVASVPYTILLNSTGNIVFEHTGYTPGDELELEEKIKELKK
jgi:cytochrome c biogenesis protein CcmG, thiol:disulfide interchange protein DsbE